MQDNQMLHKITWLFEEITEFQQAKTEKDRHLEFLDILGLFALYPVLMNDAYMYGVDLIKQVSNMDQATLFGKYYPDWDVKQKDRNRISVPIPILMGIFHKLSCTEL